MFYPSKRLLQAGSVVALILAGVALAPLVVAEDAVAPAVAAAPAPDTVFATVNGEIITQLDVALASQDLAQQLDQVPPEQRQAFVLNVLIETKLAAKAAVDAKLDESEDYLKQMAYLREQVLRSTFLTTEMAKLITPEAIQAKYDEFASTFVPEDEVRASHILVATEEEAKAVEAELAAGAVFADVAKAKSIDPGKDNGGDLGFFSKQQMVAPFAEAAFALTEPGQLSVPVQTQFGWHVIQFAERRKTAPPALDQVLDQVRQQVQLQAYIGLVGKLRDAATIEIADPAVKAAVDLLLAPPAADAPVAQ